MSSQHKRPLFAFVIVALACAVFMGYSIKADALIGMIARGDGAALVRAGERVMLGGLQARAADDGSRSAVAEGSAPGDVFAPRQGPAPSKTARPRPRTTPGDKARRAWVVKERVTPQQEEHHHRVTPQLDKPQRDGQHEKGWRPPRGPTDIADPPVWQLPVQALRGLTEHISGRPDLDLGKGLSPGM